MLSSHRGGLRDGLSDGIETAMINQSLHSKYIPLSNDVYAHPHLGLDVRQVDDVLKQEERT